MSIPKHLRPRWRYLVVSLDAPAGADLSRRSFQAAVWSAGRSLLGDPGSADADLTVVRFSFADGEGTALVRARRNHVDAARAAVACVDAVEGDPLGVWVRGVGGTIRACDDEFL